MRLNNATIKQVIVSPATLGERLRLCGIRPYNEYINGNRTDTVLGYTYTAVSYTHLTLPTNSRV